MISKPRILCVAITGSLSTKIDNPAVPILVPEQIGGAQDALRVSRAARIATGGDRVICAQNVVLRTRSYAG